MALALPTFATMFALGQVLSQLLAAGAEPEPVGQGEGLPRVIPLAMVTNGNALGSQ